MTWWWGRKGSKMAKKDDLIYVQPLTILPKICLFSYFNSEFRVSQKYTPHMVFCEFSASWQSRLKTLDIFENSMLFSVAEICKTISVPLKMSGILVLLCYFNSRCKNMVKFVSIILRNMMMKFFRSLKVATF